MKLKQLIIVLVIILFPFISFSQAIQYTIKGTVNPQYNKKIIRLYYTKDNDEKFVDSTKIDNGRFTFTGKLDRPVAGKVTLGNEDDGDRIDLFLAGGTVNVSTKDSIRYATVAGGEMVKAYEQLAKVIRPLDDKLINGLLFYKQMPEGEAKKAYIKKLMAGFDSYRFQKREAIHKFLAENPDSYVSLYFLNKNSPQSLLNYEATYPFFDRLSERIKQSPLGKELEGRLLTVKGKLTGEQFKDFVSTTPEGTELSLKDVVSKNKYTLVDFWASWCGPCRKENPNVVKTFNAFKDKGFTVLSVSLDDNGSKWKAAIQSDGMPWYHVSSLKGWKEPAAALYNIRAIPQNVLVDAHGKIVATNLREETLYNKIQSLLN